MKGNFAWGSYGRFSAGSWRILGGSSASSRPNFGKFSAKSLQVLGSSRQNLCKFSADRKTSKGCQKDSLREAKRPLREAKRPPGCPKGAEKGAKRDPKAPQNRTKSRLYLQIIFGWLPGCHLNNCAPHFGSILDPFWEPKSLIFHVIFWLRFCMHFWRPLAAFLVSFWMVFGCLFWYFSGLCEKWRTPRKCCK